MKRFIEQGHSTPPPVIQRIMGTMLIEYGQRGFATTALSLAQVRRQAEVLRTMRRDRMERAKHDMQLGVKTNLLFIKKPQIQFW